MIKAVIFDLDGVIVSTDDCHFRAWKRMADAGIEAGKRAGMKTLAVQGAKGADFSAESLEKCDLISLL